MAVPSEAKVANPISTSRIYEPVLVVPVPAETASVFWSARTASRTAFPSPKLAAESWLDASSVAENGDVAPAADAVAPSA